jgi:uncharacterized membrane protein
MNTSYNRIAGQSVERLAALSDGIFAVAMTLLVLDLRVPTTEAVHSEHDLWRALVVLAPRFVMYLMSFLTLGIFWVGQQTQLNHLERSDRHLTWIHLTFLLAVTIMPFSTTLLAEHSLYRIALLTYWANILLLGSVLYGSWGYAIRRRLVKDKLPPDVPAAICRRIVIGQSLYAFGTLLCVFNTYWSIAVIVLVQLNYAIGAIGMVAPQDRRRSSGAPD